MTEGEGVGEEVPPLRYILTTEGLKDAFRIFAEQQRSEENLLFWWDVESYRNSKEDELPAKAKEISEVISSVNFLFFILNANQEIFDCWFDLRIVRRG